MATKLILRNAISDFGLATNSVNLRGTATAGWDTRVLGTQQGASLLDLGGVATVTGATAGVEYSNAAQPLEWISAPVAADVTISGAITWNLWAAENNASANVAINGILEKIDGATNALTEIDRTARVTEVSVSTTARTVNNFVETPAAGVLVKKGDRLRARVYADDAGTMAAGFTFQFGFGAATGVDGDSWLSITETLTFAATPAGTQVFASDRPAPNVATVAVDREAWTLRGGGVLTDVTNTAAGWTAGITVTDTAGGTAVDWFTRPLNAFTLGGAVRCNVRALESNIAANAAIGVQIAVTDSVGTAATAVVWARGVQSVNELTTTEANQFFLISGADLAVTNGQRLRIRIFIDDANIAAMGTGNTVTTFYAGASGATGDTYFTFSQTLTEYLAPFTAWEQMCLTDGATGMWRFDDPVSSTTFRDRMNGQTGYGVFGTTTFGVTGPLTSEANTAVSLNGASPTGLAVDYNATYHDLGDVFSVEVFIKRNITTGTAGVEEVVFDDNSNGPGLIFHASVANQLAIVKSGVSIIATSSVLWTNTNYHHVIYTKNGATNALYIDGVNVIGTVTNATMASPAQSIVWGRDHSSGGHLNAVIANGAIYPGVALTQTQVNNHYAVFSPSAAGFPYIGGGYYGG